MVRLEGQIRRYIGHSSDRKPMVGAVMDDGTTVSASDLPAGSSFLEEDTGRIFRWTGYAWSDFLPDDGQTVLLAAILHELKAMREERRTGLEIA